MCDQLVTFEDRHLVALQSCRAHEYKLLDVAKCLAAWCCSVVCGRMCVPSLTYSGISSSTIHWWIRYLVLNRMQISAGQLAKSQSM